MPRSSVFFFMLVVLIDSIGFGIIIPVMPSLLRQLGAGDARHAVAFGGALTFAYAIMQFFCAPVVGALSDRFGRRVVLLASMLAFTLDYALMAIVPYFWMLFIGRLVAGITGACYPTANAAIADVTPPEERAKNFGLTGMAFGVGFILGPLAGGWIGTLGPRAPFVAAAILAALNFVYGLLVVPETLAPEKRRPFSFATANPFGALRDVARLREIRGVLAALFLWQLAFQALPSTWAYFTQAAFGWTSSAVGTSMGFSGVTMAVVL
ncbi:MAG: MFS transporter, partial [Candidatus Eremiobacteraeota bacterium]|nr:MFS transporter [Candidatus Eremiobacteraeota bacterium]